jgi:hypothetical protein
MYISTIVTLLYSINAVERLNRHAESKRVRDDAIGLKMNCILLSRFVEDFEGRLFRVYCNGIYRYTGMCMTLVWCPYVGLP